MILEANCLLPVGYSLGDQVGYSTALVLYSSTRECGFGTAFTLRHVNYVIQQPES